MSVSSSSSSSSSDGSLFLVADMFYNALKRRRTRKRRRESKLHRLLPFWRTVTFNQISEALGPKLFQKCYRMSKPAFYLLLSQIEDLITKPFKGDTMYRRSIVPPEVRLGITLRILAGESYLDIVLAYQIAENTIRNIFHDTCDAIMHRLRLKSFPKTVEALTEISRRFQTSRKEVSPLSGCVGAVDGICVKIKKPMPEENPAMFYCRKGFYAVPVQALVDSDYIFRFCSATCTGATHDSLAFSVSGLQ